jgi:hypothetical protein
VVTDQPAWRNLLRAVLHAPSLAGAQLAASDLIDAAVPGGAILAGGASALVREVRATADLAANPYRGYVVLVLATMATMAHVWQDQVEGGNTSESATSGARAERETADDLGVVCQDLMPLLDDRDPEVRGLLYLLVGGAGTPVYDKAELLRQHTLGEENELARACGYQALARVAGRMTAAHAAEIGSWLANALRVESDDVGKRLRVELESHARTVEAQQRLEAALGLRAVDLPSGHVPMWPSESV